MMHASFTSWRCAPGAEPTCHGFGFWKHGRRGRSWGGPSEEMDDDFGTGGFGVRRPLRFLAHKLDLDDRQVAALARILDALKTERAQAEVDRRRPGGGSSGHFADEHARRGPHGEQARRLNDPDTPHITSAGKMITSVAEVVRLRLCAGAEVSRLRLHPSAFPSCRSNRIMNENDP